MKATKAAHRSVAKAIRLAPLAWLVPVALGLCSNACTDETASTTAEGVPEVSADSSDLVAWDIPPSQNDAEDISFDEADVPVDVAEDPSSDLQLDIAEDSTSDRPVDRSTDTELDLPPGCSNLTLTEVDATALNVYEPLLPNAERSFRVQLTHSLDCHQSLAMPDIVIQEGERVAEIQARVWSGNFFCAGPSILVQRYLVLRLPTPGTWSVQTSGGPSLTVEVADGPDRACEPDGIDCEMDCDCHTSEVCLSATGMGGDFLGCAEPCEIDFDCITGHCISWDDGFDRVCDESGPGCDGDSCPEGYACDDADCTATFQLSQSTRAECFCDEQCESPLRCVRGDDLSNPGQCEIPCSAATGFQSMGTARWCGPMHICNPQGENPSVCEWVGE